MIFASQTYSRRCLEVIESAPQSVVLVYPQCEFINERGEVISVSTDHLESKAKQPCRRLVTVVRKVSKGSPTLGLDRAECLRRTRLNGSVSYGDLLLLAELSLCGEISEIPAVLFQERCHRENALAICAVKQGGMAQNYIKRRTEGLEKFYLLGQIHPGLSGKYGFQFIWTAVGNI